MPACPAYLMALPTKIDPMLGYLTTGFQDHVRLREKFGLKVNDRMQQFFLELGILDAAGKPAANFGNPAAVYLQYRRRKGDSRNDAAILAEGAAQLKTVRSHGVFVATGHGENPWDLEPALAESIEKIYTDARKCIWAVLTPEFKKNLRETVQLTTRSADRMDYILHPQSGEVLSAASEEAVRKLRKEYNGRQDVQIVISDGLDALAIMDEGHLEPFLAEVRHNLEGAGLRVSPTHLVVNSGRVRAGYRIGEALFGSLPGNRAILHIIGERPGTGHHTFSVYISAPAGVVWGEPGKVDHNITKVVSGIATTAQLPAEGAAQTARILRTMMV
jgi:ethanolamine ammonia-lyase large subunit